MTTQEPTNGHSWHIFGSICLIVLLGSCLALLTSIYGKLVGPRHFSILGIFGFLVAAIGWAIAQRLFLPAHPKGLCDVWPHVSSLESPAAWAAKALKLVAVISILTMLLSARLDGVIGGGGPVFAAREKYELNNHGKKTEVSKARYLTIGTSFVLGWHSMALFFAVSAMRTFMYGERAAEAKASNDKPENL